MIQSWGSSLSPERLRELRKTYSRAVRYASQRETMEAWLRYLAALYKEAGDLRFFSIIRVRPRSNGARLDEQLLRGEITPRQHFRGIRYRCADLYAKELNFYGVASIDITDQDYQDMTKNLAIEVLQALKGVDPDDKTEFCTAMAKTWNKLVRVLHGRYGLPDVQTLRAKVSPDSEAEEAVLDRNVFDTPMTPRERREWELQVI